MRQRGAIVAANPVPGSRAVVRYAEDPGWDHERLLLVRLDEQRWVVYTPGNDMYVESMSDHERCVVMRGRWRFPRDVEQVVSFSRPLEDSEVLVLIVRARAEAACELGRPATDVAVYDAIGWGGRPLVVPEASAVSAPRVRLRGKQALALPAARGTATPELLEPDDGCCWLVAELGPTFGRDVRLGAGDVRRGRHGLHSLGAGRFVAVEMVALDSVQVWRRAKLQAARELLGEAAAPDLDGRLFGPSDARLGDTPPAAAAAAREEVEGGPAPAAPEPEDLRTCWIDVDDAGIRYKEWRRVVLESTQENFKDAPIRGPPTCLAICRKMQQHGGNPKLWFAEWTKETGISRRDRAWHEMNSLIEALYVAGTYDQVNVGALVCLEVVSRRLLQYVEAYAHGAENPN